MNSTTRLYLTFECAGRTYGIDVTDVKEILPFSGVTKVPMVPEVIRGVINLRGNVVPVIDLAARFAAGISEVTGRACILILDSSEEENAEAGILVSSVSVAIEIAPDDIEEAPAFGVGIRQDFVRCMARVGASFFPILEMRRVLDLQELALIVNKDAAARTENAR